MLCSLQLQPRWGYGKRHSRRVSPRRLQFFQRRGGLEVARLQGQVIDVDIPVSPLQAYSSDILEGYITIVGDID